MEGDVMQKLASALFLVGLAATATGCNKSPSQEPTTTPARSPVSTRGIDLEETPQRHARRMKRDFDEIAQEAEEAAHTVRTGLKREAEKRSAELSAYASQIAEEAKDRAEDIPEAVDRALERHTRRWQESQRKEKRDKEWMDKDDWPF